jgi:hypothetical protein
VEAADSVDGVDGEHLVLGDEGAVDIRQEQPDRC